MTVGRRESAKEEKNPSKQERGCGRAGTVGRGQCCRSSSSLCSQELPRPSSHLLRRERRVVFL